MKNKRKENAYIMQDDLISRRAALNALYHVDEYNGRSVKAIKDLPPTQPTLYGYKIEHLAYIASVMKREGVTADYAAKTFDDIARALRIIIDETQEKVVEALNGRYDLQTGSD